MLNKPTRSTLSKDSPLYTKSNPTDSMLPHTLQSYMEICLKIT